MRKDYLEESLQEDELAQQQKSSGMMRIIRALGYSFEGIIAALKHEAAFRQEFLASCVLIPLALLFPFGWTLTILMILSCSAVMIVELLNSALEWVVDYISLEKHPMAKRVKDMGSGAVFLSLLNAVGIWVYALIKHWRAISDWINH